MIVPAVQVCISFPDDTHRSINFSAESNGRVNGSHSVAETPYGLDDKHGFSLETAPVEITKKILCIPFGVGQFSRPVLNEQCFFEGARERADYLDRNLNKAQN